MRGARQVGKTYLVQHWGAQHFESVVTLDLERERDLHGLFSQPEVKLMGDEARTVQLLSLPLYAVGSWNDF